MVFIKLLYVFLLVKLVKSSRNQDSEDSISSALLRRDGWVRLPSVLQDAGFDVESTARLVKDSVEKEQISCSTCSDIESLDDANERCYGCDISMRQQTEDNVPRAFLRARRLHGIEDIIRSRKLGKIVANAMNASKIRLYQASAFVKRSGDAPSVFHQDAQAAPFDSDNLVTLWIALNDLKQDCGPLKFLNGSHHPRVRGSSRDIRPIARRLGKSEIFDLNDDEIAKLTRCSVIKPPEEGMKAGAATLHLGWTFHGADSHSCEEDRYGLAIMYFVDGARIDKNLVLIEDENGYDFSGQAAQHDDGDEYAVKLNMFRHTLFIRLLADDSITWLRWLKRKPMPLLINGAEVNDDILTPVIYDSSSDEVRNEL
jgi:hypothetical protein